MLQQEFEARVKMSVSREEYVNIIEPMYMAADVDKDDFCYYWRKMNYKRVETAIKERKDAEYREWILNRCWKLSDKISRRFRISEQTLTLAKDALSERDIKLLNALGIDMRESHYSPLGEWFSDKNLSTISYELGNWIAAHALVKFDVSEINL